MAITPNGSTKIISLDTVTSFDAKAIHDACVDYLVQSGNMKYLWATTGSGKAPFGGGNYSDSIFTLENGWKIKTVGYAAGTIITIKGTLVSSSGTDADIVDASSTGVLIFARASYGSQSVISTGSGVTAQDKQDIATLAQQAIVPLVT